MLPARVLPPLRLVASRWALLVLLALPRAPGQPSGEEPCDYETNRIKDSLQAGCEGKGLSEVPRHLRKGTGILLLGSNRLARVSTASFGHLPNLTDLDLSRNGMGELEAASPLPGLRELDLSHNALETLPALRGFPNLLRLALGHNALSRLPTEGGFQALGQLVDLELQGNRLEHLPEEAFVGLAALKDLDLSDNRLVALPPGLLADLEALETLRLERNQLRSVPEGFFPEGQDFAYVYLTGNPWLCDCALEYLRNWILENGFSIYTRVQGPGKEITENQPENVTCHNPPGEQGRPVMDFQLDCEPESDRGLQGDEEEEEGLQPWPGPGPTTAHPATLPGGLSTLPGGLSTLPATTTASSTQPQPSPMTPPTPPLAHAPPTRAPPPPPAPDCPCPLLLPGVALGLSSPQPSPASWGAWLAAHCCPLRLALYVACLALVSLPSLALLCWGVWACRAARPLRAKQSVLGPQMAGYQPLQMALPEGEGRQLPPRRPLYRACKRLEIGPPRYVSWLLVSLPGPSGRWPWEREGGPGPGKDPPKGAAPTPTAL